MSDPEWLDGRVERRAENQRREASWQSPRGSFEWVASWIAVLVFLSPLLIGVWYRFFGG